MKNEKYYVVQGEDRAGIYQSLADALYQVNQYPFSKLLEFTSLLDAASFLDQSDVLKKQTVEIADT